MPASSGHRLVVAIGVPYSDALRQEIAREVARVAPHAEVRDIAALIREERRLRREGSQAEGLAKAKADLDKHLVDVNILFTLPVVPDLPARAPRLRWVHFISAGVDHVMTQELVRSPVQVTDSGGITSAGMAEYALGVMLLFAKRLWTYERQKRKREWCKEDVIPVELHGHTVGILGVGGIGLQVARLAKAFGMRVLGVRRGTTAPETGVGDVDEMLSPSALHDMLGRSDYVVIALPATKDTERLFGERELRAMKPSAYLVNVGRGSVVDEPALVRALKEGWIAGAGLDVFSREPLPPESELWGLPNVYMTPHVSGNLLGVEPPIMALFCDNLRRYLVGEPMKNLVNKEAGY